jgi:hypothetical protein
MARYNKHTVRGIVRLTIRLKNEGMSWNDIYRLVKKGFPVYRGSVGALSQLWLAYKDKTDELTVPKRRTRREQPEDVAEQTPHPGINPTEAGIETILRPIINKEIRRRAAELTVNILEKALESFTAQVRSYREELKNGEIT